MGYFLTLMGMLSFGALGLLSKLAESRGASPIGTTFALFVSAVGTLGIYLGLSPSHRFATAGPVIGIAVIFGAISMLASWTFLYGLKFGKITTSWVLINLSAVIPTIASTWIYGERMTLRKVGLLLLAVVAVVLLWKDKQQEAGALTPGDR